MSRGKAPEVTVEDEAEIDVHEIEREHSRIEEQLEKLQELVKKYQSEAVQAKEKGDPETLSNCLIRLARINSALGSKAAFAKYVARNAERVYRRDREHSKLRHIEMGMAIGKAESQGFVDADKSFKIYTDVQLLADTADDLAYRTDTFMKMSQSGLSLIKKDLHGV